MSFRLILEIGIPREPDIKKILRQVEIFAPVVDAILIPDNHLGLTALSSVAIGIEVRSHGVKPLVALNARDRNTRRLRSDLLTLRAYGIDEVLFVYGDKVSGDRSSLTVKQMLDDEEAVSFRKGVTAVIGKPLGWRRKADFLMTQLAFDRSRAGYWREAQGFSQSLYCGVIALPNRELARKYLGNIPDLDLPKTYLDAFAVDGEAGLKAAISEIDDLYRSGIDGAHLVAPARWIRFAELLSEWSSTRELR